MEQRWRERGLRDAVLAGDERAWREWYDAEYAALERYVRWRTGGLPDLADDVLQETWLTAIKRLRRFDPERGSFRSWLMGIAVNVLRNSLRKRRPSTPLTGSETADVADRDRSERIAHALAALPEHYEHVLRLKYLEGCSVVEIATLLSDTPKAIESQLTRARTAFRTAYGDDP